MDADHIRLDTVDRFLPHSRFLHHRRRGRHRQAGGRGASPRSRRGTPSWSARVAIPGIEKPFNWSRAEVERIANKYSAGRAGSRNDLPAHRRGQGRGETSSPRSPWTRPTARRRPPELLVILAAIADERIPIQTIAPKFTGRFNKGVDYVGDVAQFEKEFNDDLAVIAYAVKQYGLPDNLKLSVHSGSDKFSIYGPIRRASGPLRAGLHSRPPAPRGSRR